MTKVLQYAVAILCGTAHAAQAQFVTTDIHVGRNAQRSSVVLKPFDISHAPENVPSTFEFVMSDGTPTGMVIKNFRDGSYNSQSIEFTTHHGGVSVGPRMVIDKDGRVGIGTSTPERALEVVGQIRSTEDSNEGGQLVLRNPKKTGSSARNWALYNMTGPYGDSFQIWSYPESTESGCCWSRFQIRDDGTTVMSPSGGNVGIGTSTPQAKLDVNGDVQLAGRIAQNGGLSLSSDGGSSTIHHPQRQHIRAGERIYLLPDGDAVVVGKTLLMEGGSAQVIASRVVAGTLELTSDRNAKQDFRPISEREIAAKVAGLPVISWAYTNSPSVRHIGPMAQDFKAAFPEIGEDDKHIGAGDGIGVALAAIKGLHEIVQEKDSEISRLRAELSSMKKELSSLKDDVADRLASLEHALSNERQTVSAKVSDAR